MTLEDLDKMAYELQPLPEGLQPPEIYYFLTMRTLYALYAFRKLSAEQAKQEKKQMSIASQSHPKPDLRIRKMDSEFPSWRSG